LWPGTIATFPGMVPERARVWAAVLYCGEGAAAGHRTALWLAGASDNLPEVIDICIPDSRRVRGQAGLRIRRRQGLAADVHPALCPPRVRLETAVLDVAAAAGSAEQAVDPVLRATQRRLTTATRLRAELARRPRQRWRGLLGEVLVDVEDGVASTLERRFARQVERAHGLPRGGRNSADRDPVTGRRRYRDVRHRGFGLVVELEGQEAHPTDEAFRDLDRDNAAVVGGSVVMRFGRRDVAERPCLVAAQVAAVLTQRGWTGTPRPCHPGLPSPDQR
jgi:hypothetical protein